LARPTQIRAVKPGGQHKPAPARKATVQPRPASSANHLRAGDLASVVQFARTAARADVPHAGKVARDFGLPLSALEIHAGGAAEEACRRLGARAFAVQNLVVFASPRPSLPLVRHEFAHVVQQGGATHPAPKEYRPGSLSRGAADGEFERQADAAAAGRFHEVEPGAPVAVQCKVPVSEPGDDDQPTLDRARNRLIRLASIIKLTQGDGKDPPPKFGVTQDFKGDDPKFDPAFLVSSEEAWTVDDYMAAADIEQRAARTDLSDLIFKRDNSKKKLARDSVAGEAIKANNKFLGPVVLWASRALPQDVSPKVVPGDDGPQAPRTTFYAFLGTYREGGRKREIREKDENEAPIVNERDRFKRGKPVPKESLESYIVIVEMLEGIAKKEKKDVAGADEAIAEIQKLIDGPDKKTPGEAYEPGEDQARDGRRALEKWVRDAFDTIDDFFTFVIQPQKGPAKTKAGTKDSEFPDSWNSIKGALQEKFIADLGVKQKTEAKATQVWFGVKASANLKLKPSSKLGAFARGDGYIRDGDTLHILESKARNSKPAPDEIDQMEDYKKIVTKPRVSGFLIVDGKISERLGTFEAVEYYLGMTTIPQEGEPLRDIAEAWTVALYQAFKPEKDEQKAKTNALSAAAVKVPGYFIHPNLTGKKAKDTTIKINPLVTLPIPTPNQVDQSVPEVPAKQAGVAIRNANFKLAQPGEAEIASGSLEVGLDMGGEIKSASQPTAQEMQPVPRESAKPERPGGPIVYGRVENRFEKLSSSIDKFFKERVTTDARLTDAGVEASLRISRGSSGIPGITLDEAVVSATFGARGLSAKGQVGLSNDKGNIKGAIVVTWNATGKQWKVTGDVTFTNIVDGLKPFKATFLYDPANDETTIAAREAGIEKKYGAITLTGNATDLKYDVKAGAFSGNAALKAKLGAFGEAEAKSTIKNNQIDSATLSYTTPKFAYPKTSPALAGELKGSVTYTAGQNPGDAPSFAGEIEVNAEIHAAALKKLAKGGTLGVTGTVKISKDGKFSGSIGTTEALTLGQHFRIPPFHADVGEDGALTLDFSLEVVDIGPLKDAKVDALINDKGFTIKGADVKFAFGSDKDRVWGSLRVIYKPGDKAGDLTVGGTINVRIKEGLVAHGEAIYDNQKESVSATLSIDEITLLKYGPNEHKLVDFSKQVELISFYKVIGIYLDVGFKLAFTYEFDLRLKPSVTLDDFSFKTLQFSRARALMRLLGQMVATLTGTPNIGLGVFVISTKLLRGGGGIEIPIVGSAALALDPPLTIEVIYTPDGGLSGGGTAGLTLLFGVTGTIQPYAEFDVLSGTYPYKWHGEPLAGFVLLKERPIFTYVVNFGKPLTTETNPTLPEGKDPPAKASGARSFESKAQGKPRGSAVDTQKPAEETEPKKKPPADSDGGFDLGSMVSKLLDEPSFAGARRIMDAAAETWAVISGFIGAIVKFVRNWIGGTIDLIVGAIKALGQKNLVGFFKDLLKKHMHPVLFHVIEPLLDQMATVEQDLYDLFDLTLPTSVTEFLEFAVMIVKKVLKLAWDSLPGLVKALYKMIENAIDAARGFAQYLVDTGKLGVARSERYIGIEGTRLEHDFLLADQYKIKFGGVNLHEKDDSSWPSADKAIGWGLWHLLKGLGVNPTTTEINRDTGEAYDDFWMPLPVERQVRGAGAIAANAPQKLAAAHREPGIELPRTLRQSYESALGADLGAIRVHVGSAAAAAARAIDARAFTVGRHIHFDAGEFSPGTRTGDHLLAHELAHAAWSPKAGRQPYGFAVMPPSAASERAAEAIAERVAPL
jgi:hypothetical protein